MLGAARYQPLQHKVATWAKPEGQPVALLLLSGVQAYWPSGRYASSWLPLPPRPLVTIILALTLHQVTMTDSPVSKLGAEKPSGQLPAGSLPNGRGGGACSQPPQQELHHALSRHTHSGAESWPEHPAIRTGGGKELAAQGALGRAELLLDTSPLSCAAALEAQCQAPDKVQARLLLVRSHRSANGTTFYCSLTSAPVPTSQLWLLTVHFAGSTGAQSGPASV